MSKHKKSAWRAYLAMFLVAVSDVGLVWGVLNTRLAGLRLIAFLLAILLGLMAVSLGQDDGRERGENR